MVNLFPPYINFFMIVGVLVDFMFELAKLYIFNAVAQDLKRVGRVDFLL